MYHFIHVLESQVGDSWTGPSFRNGYLGTWAGIMVGSSGSLEKKKGVEAPAQSKQHVFY